MSTASINDRLNEVLFVLGLLVGVVVVAIGFVFMILGLSVGVREAEFFLAARARTYAILAGVVLVVAGVGLRAVRHRLAGERVRLALRYGGFVVAIVGVVAFLIGFSAGQTSSAPYLPSMEQKVLLMLSSLAFVGVGATIVRLAGRRIGW